MKLSGKTALVTGGGTGIGWGIATAFAREGCRVAIAGRREDKLREAAGRFEGSPGILIHVVDVADRQSVAELFQWVQKTLGPLDILVNSAGTNVKRRSTTDTVPEEWDQLMNVNATGTFNCIREALPAMRARQEGLIVNISSVSGKRASKLGGWAYSASKFAMTALGMVVGMEENKHNIRVTNIYPGEVDTPLLEKRPVVPSAEQRKQILLPEDVAAAALMVACLPARAHIPELVIKPTIHDYA